MCNDIQTIPNLDDLDYKSLVSEREQLEIGLKQATTLCGIAETIATFHLSERLEQVRRAIQAFEKITVRHLKAHGLPTCQYTR